PSAEVRVEFISGTIGSRSINSVLRAAWKVATKHPWTAGSLTAIAGTFLVAPASHVADDITDHFAKVWFGHEDDVLSDHDVERVAEAVVNMERNKVAVEHRREVYRQANREPVIVGVGSTPLIGERPPLVIPRTEFPARIGVEETIEETTGTRTIWKRNYPVT